MKTFARASLALCVAGCSALPPSQPVVTRLEERPLTGNSPVRPTPASAAADARAGVTILPGRPAPLLGVPPTHVSRSGPYRLNYPSVDVQAVARAVLGDILHQPYQIAPELHTAVTLETPGVRRADILPAFEDALRVAGLGLVAQPGGSFAILPVDQAKSLAPVDANPAGFASEVIPLRFVNADELRKLIDPVIPGVVTGSDPAHNAITVAGTEGQREAARALVRDFDVDWLRGTSFALFIPHRTDARLIAPELDKVLNADSSPTRNMVRFIAMDRLNGILAISSQSQYLDDVARWVEILDREGESSARRVFVYQVEHNRAADLAKVLAGAFGASAGGGRLGGGSESPDRATAPPAALSGDLQGGAAAQPPPTAPGVAPGALPPGLGGTAATQAPSSLTPNVAVGAGSAEPANFDVQSDDFHAHITSDDLNNAIVVYATPRDYALVADALRKLDVAPYQVMIEAAIAEVTLTDALRFGVQGLFNKGTLSTGLTQSLTSASPLQIFPGFSTLYSARTVSAALNALEDLTTVNVISAPKLMVLNNQTASIQVGEQVPILTGTATNVVTSSAAVVDSIDYRDTGIILKVTPRVNSSGMVLLDLAQEVSAVVPASTTATVASPTFSNRRIATSVAVHDGDVVALGGMISDNRTDEKTGLPVLSRIPVLGPMLFGSVNNNESRTELVVLLHPTVVRNTADEAEVTDEIREKLQGLKKLLPGRAMP